MREDGGSVRSLSVGIEKHLRTFQRLAGIDADILRSERAKKSAFLQCMLGLSMDSADDQHLFAALNLAIESLQCHQAGRIDGRDLSHAQKVWLRRRKERDAKMPSSSTVDHEGVQLLQCVAKGVVLFQGYGKDGAIDGVFDVEEEPLRRAVG